jgi:choline dehydrogenase
VGEADPDAYDYVVVGSGAGGGVVAARLAEAGMSVLVLEAGADPATTTGEGLPQDYDVPAFHAFASENPAIAWNYYVRDFGGDAKRRARPAGSEAPGVLYPRASTLGGCTAHHAMIFMAPPDSDWDAIAEETGDPSWRGEAMRRYFRKIDDCRYRPFWRFVHRLTAGRVNPTGHGFDGWLPVERPVPAEALGDRALISVIRNAARVELFGHSPSRLKRALGGLIRFLDRWPRIVLGEADPNDVRMRGRFADGLTKVPLSTEGGRRRGARERVTAVIAARHPLSIEYDALAARVLFAGTRAVGVEYLKGRSLYSASPLSPGQPGETRRVFAKREVILAAGAFNTPQLLMLSGIGPEPELREKGIAVRVPLEGVGRNLQDRYEIGAVHATQAPWSCLRDVAFSPDDPMFARWREGRGMYCSNGAAVAFIRRSSVAGEAPDLFAMALLTRFSGYFPGYSKDIYTSRSDLTFAVLKGHTVNCGGSVTLASADPRATPLIDFRGFEEGTDAKSDDLTAVAEGLAQVRAMTRRLEGAALKPEDIPGPAVQGEEPARQFIRDYAWGHHASCTCPIGRMDKGGVLTSDFRVHGTQGLRVVDASVFPRIPGFFIVSGVYMIAEKAAEALLAEARDSALARL